MKKKFTVTPEQHVGIRMLMSEIRRQLSQEDGSPLDPQLVYLTLQEIIESDSSDNKKKNPVLRLVSVGVSLIIGACDGSKTLANSEKIFKVHLNKNIHLGNGLERTPSFETAVEVYETEKNVTPAEIFFSLADELDKLCLSEHQVVVFCKKYYQWLRIGSYSPPTFFMFKGEKDFFLAHVFAASSGDLALRVDRFKHGDGILPAGVRIVVPELIS
jgi:hypothetical protein